MAYRGSQARWSNQSCSCWPTPPATATPDLSHVCNLHHSSWQCWVLNPLSKAGDRTLNLMVPSWIRFRCATTGTPTLNFKGYFSCEIYVIFWDQFPKTKTQKNTEVFPYDCCLYTLDLLRPKIKTQHSRGDSSGNCADVVQEWGLMVIKFNIGTEFRQRGASWDLVLYIVFPKCYFSLLPFWKEMTSRRFRI